MLIENSIPINPCMIMHLFVYTPNQDFPLVREMLCNCSKCLKQEFENLKKKKIIKRCEYCRPTTDFKSNCNIAYAMLVTTFCQLFLFLDR